MTDHPNTTERVVVEPGQVWADNDRRSRGRTIKVLSVWGGRALCEVLTDGPHPIRSSVGRKTMIALRRFKPNSTGYRYLRDATGGRND